MNKKSAPFKKNNFLIFIKENFNNMKRTTTDDNNLIASKFVSLDGYIVRINDITKNNNNNNHHYSFIVALEDQSTVRVLKYLSKVPFCSLHNRLKESARSGRGATIPCLKEQNNQYVCTMSTKLVDKDLHFRPECIRIKPINDFKKTERSIMLNRSENMQY
jgi:hypothetical protein